LPDNKTNHVAAAISGRRCRGFYGIDRADGRIDFYAILSPVREAFTPEAHTDKSLHPSLTEALHHPRELLPVRKYGFL
jgi:hypothetical protein